MKIKIAKIFKFNSRWVLFIYAGHLDKIEYCKWLSKKIRPTHKIRHINIIHRMSDINILYNHTMILIKFNKVLKTLYKNFFNYNHVRPDIRVIKHANDFDKCKKYLPVDNIYMNYIYINIVNDNRFLINRFIDYLIELTIIEIVFNSKINSHRNFISTWLTYCKVRFLNDILLIKIDITYPQFIIDEFRLNPMIYICVMYFTVKRYF
mgnify:CR=1 FL=1